MEAELGRIHKRSSGSFMKIFSSALENFAVAIKISSRLEILGSALLAGCNPIPQVH